MQNEEKIELFEYIPVSKSVIKLALPMILSSLTVIIYNMADTFFVGMLANPDSKCGNYISSSNNASI